MGREVVQAAPTSGGVYVITRRGSVLFVTVSREAMVPFVAQSLKNTTLAIALAQRGDLPGAEPLFVQKFEQVSVPTSCFCSVWVVT